MEAAGPATVPGTRREHSMTIRTFSLALALAAATGVVAAVQRPRATAS